MDNELPEINSAGRRIEITEDDLGLTASQGAATRSTRPPAPARPTPPNAAAAMDDAAARLPTETTRLMCAAAYMKDRFAEDVVDEIIHEHHRAVQIPPGVDIAAVVKHCLAACRQKLVRDVTLMVILVLAVVLLFAERSLSWLVLGYLAAWVVILLDVWAATYYIVVKQLNPLAFASHAPPEPSDPHVAGKIVELLQEQRGNLTVYSGFQPFSGAGEHDGGWSFLVDLSKSTQEAFGERSVPREPTVSDLYNGVRRSLSVLEIANLDIRDRLFVSGSDIRDDRVLLPNPFGRPLSSVDPSVLNDFMASPTHRIRHYQCIEIVDWRGELVVSLFLRFGISNNRLFCELSRFILSPLKEELHRLDGLAGKIELGYVLSTAVRSFLSTLGLWLRSPKVIFRPLSRGRERAARARRVEKDPFFDYGAPFTALDRVRSGHYRRYFQRLDRERYDKVLERAVLDTICEILEEHGIDPGEAAGARQQIAYNAFMQDNSVNVSGGNFLGDNHKFGADVNLKGRVMSAAGAAAGKETK